MKKGISLIVLVITIIVMIVLATAVVITLSNTGIINKANQAVDKTNKKTVQELASLVWAELYMAGKRGNELETEVLAKLEDYKDVYEITITDTGITVSKKDETKQVTITFRFRDVEYEAIKGMTWREWITENYGADYFNDATEDFNWSNSKYTESGKEKIFISHIGRVYFMDGVNRQVTLVYNADDGYTSVLLDDAIREDYEYSAVL